ncbi:Mitochondrial carrier domain [Pseudocohnilembus persalinus]|uniref:Mitochondrial carrier domain n=1 Tax=Pseudocohnilembus persalinus TaxID=266149 RepID=A0A0V0QWI3_PSEPJ|nr:Mitochondrial carrier domain [Pseudocohnilembus persalinus]|eukprot:KRX06594.1 Mitochondrial carrier domain [Pseudocohnilembus persalinus]
MAQVVEIKSIGLYLNNVDEANILTLIQKQEKIQLGNLCLAGGLSSMIARCITAPIEKIRIIQEIEFQRQKNTILNVMKNIYIQGGVKGFYEGNFWNCMRIFPRGGLTCLFYSKFIQYSPFDIVQNPNSTLAICFGFQCWNVGDIFTHPLDVLRTRILIQNQQNWYKIWLEMIKQRSLFQGLFPTLFSIGPFMGIQQCSYDMLRINFLNENYGKWWQFMFFGAIAGICAQIFVHPLDVVRKVSFVQVTKIGYFDIIKSILKVGGSKMYVGVFASFLKVVPQVMTSLVMRDFLLGKL